ELLPVDTRRVRPQAFELVVRARLVEEDVHDDVAEVEEHPGRVVEPFDTGRRRGQLVVHRLLDLVDDRADLPDVRAARDHERVGDREDVTDIDGDDVAALLGGRRRRGDGSSTQDA